jgi:uncharacterized BrkB/YihY/UPF0761 family membrane protein
MSFPAPDEPRTWWSASRTSLGYLAETEVHVYALAIAASVLLSFYPFVIVTLSLCRNVLHWPAAEAAIYLALDDSLPGDLGEFIRRNLPPHGRADLIPLLLLLFTANGVFVPLEVALNRAWGAAKNRSYLRNQLVALGMIVACGSLALLSLILTALNQKWVADWISPHAGLPEWLNLVLFKAAAVPLSILSLFLVYWLLPNLRVAPARVVPAAILAGVALEAMKYISLLLFPFLREKLQREYGVFQHSALILLWSFAGALVVLAVARWSAHTPSKDSLS